MSIWLTEAELRERYGDVRVDALADRDRDNTPDVGVVEAAILDAEGRIRSELLGRYAAEDLPLTTGTTGATLKRVVAKLAWYYLNEGAYDSVSDQVKGVAADALAEVRAIKQGGAALGLDSAPTVDIARGGVFVSRRSEYSTTQPITLAAMDDWG